MDIVIGQTSQGCAETLDIKSQDNAYFIINVRQLFCIVISLLDTFLCTVLFLEIEFLDQSHDQFKNFDLC